MENLKLEINRLAYSEDDLWKKSAISQIIKEKYEEIKNNEMDIFILFTDTYLAKIVLTHNSVYNIYVVVDTSMKCDKQIVGMLYIPRI